MKKVFISVAVIIMCLALSGGLSHSAEKVITLEFSDWTPVIDPVAALLDQWCADVEKQTNGRVKINHHPGGTLTPPNQTYDAVVNGIVDVGMGPLGITAGKFPLMEVMDLPLGLKSSYMATRLANQVVKQFKPKELSDVKVLYLDTAPPSYVTTKKPVRNLEDLQGLKIRALSPVSVKGLKLLGAVPLVIPPSDLYDGLQKGVVDGTIGPILILSVMKIADVAHYTTLNMNSSLVGSGYLVMNKQKWESLPPDIQQVFDKFLELGSARQVLFWYVDNNLPLPTRKHLHGHWQESTAAP